MYYAPKSMGFCTKWLCQDKSNQKGIFWHILLHHLLTKGSAISHHTFHLGGHKCFHLSIVTFFYMSMLYSLIHHLPLDTLEIHYKPICMGCTSFDSGICICLCTINYHIGFQPGNFETAKLLHMGLCFQRSLCHIHNQKL